MTSIAELLAGKKDGRSFGYSLMDNIVGYDDGVDTPGERIGAGINGLGGALISDPIGSIGGVVSGVQTDLDDLMFQGGAERRPEDVLGYAAAPMAPGARNLMKYDPETVNIFAGRNAKTADLDAMAQAEKMLSDGVSRDDVWRDTGWMRGVDGKMRFEIDDSQSGLTGYATDGVVGEAGEAVGLQKSMTRHPDLFTAYPRLGDINTGFSSNYVRGGEFRATPGQVSPGQITAFGPGTDNIHTTNLHELQHAVQSREGFSSGANPKMFGAKRDEVDAAAKRAYEDSSGDNALLRELGLSDAPEVPQTPWDDLTERQRLGWYDRGREGMYSRNAGEVEARNVEARRAFTPDQRRATPPWATQDIPDDQQIVRGVDEITDYLQSIGAL